MGILLVLLVVPACLVLVELLMIGDEYDDPDDES